jgi:hypothetical protein
LQSSLMFGEGESHEQDGERLLIGTTRSST